MIMLKMYMNKLDCKTSKDYHMPYLNYDVLLLADVFETFRKTCISSYKLDTANYLTCPSLAWDALLTMTNIKLEQISDMILLDIIERMKRGGLCFVGSKRYVEANNRYVGNYDINKPEIYLMYWDANNSYGWAMSQLLRYKNLEFSDIALEDVLRIPDDNEKDCIAGCL